MYALEEDNVFNTIYESHFCYNAITRPGFSDCFIYECIALTSCYQKYFTMTCAY